MSEKKKSVLVETLEEIQTAKQQIEENANFILSTTLKEELSEIIRKGLTESTSPEGEENTEDIAADDTATDQAPVDDAPVSDETPSDIPGEEPTATADEVPSGLDGASGGEEVVDLTGATPEEVIGSFKLMAPTDEIEIVKSDNGISINFPSATEDPAITPAIDGVEDNSISTAIEPPATDASADSTLGGPDTDEVPGDVPAEDPAAEPESGEEDEIYEIEITEDDVVDEAMSHNMNMKKRHIAHNGNDPLRVDEEPVSDEETVTEETPVNETHTKLVAARKKNTALTLENRKLKADLAGITESTNTFKTSEAEYKQAISKLKAQLIETALFTSNLTYAVKLMTENVTTKDEKIQILKRLDSAKTVNESREVYKTLTESYQANKTSASALIENRMLNEDKISGASKINETSVYTNPSVERIKEIINHLNKK